MRRIVYIIAMACLAGQDHECFLVKNKQVASSKEL